MQTSWVMSPLKLFPTGVAWILLATLSRAQTLPPKTAATPALPQSANKKPAPVQGSAPDSTAQPAPSLENGSTEKRLSADKKGAATSKPGAATSGKKKAAALQLNVSMRDGLRFDPPRLSVAPGQEFVLTIENADTTHQTHNFVLTKPGTLQATVQASMALGEKGPAQNFVPQSSDILAQTAVLAPDQSVRLKVKVDELGIYPYVCTFPGHGMVMYGALYVGVQMPELSKDPNVPTITLQAMTAGGGRRPFVQRMFMPDSGPASIAVALPAKQNFCWDSVQCRIRYAWEGTFIDASEHWSANGRHLAKLPSPPWWNAPNDALVLRFGKPEALPAKLEFRGYRMENGLPEFHYLASGHDVFQTITESADGSGFKVRYKIPKAPGTVLLSLGTGGAWTVSAGEKPGENLQLTAAQAQDFNLQLSSSQK
jgi:azurin